MLITFSVDKRHFLGPYTKDAMIEKYLLSEEIIVKSISF